MASRLRAMNDLRWSDAGDLLRDSRDGDLEDTRRYNYEGFIQRLETRVRSRIGDWLLAPDTGATLSRYVGKPNTAEVGKAIEMDLMNELTRGGLVLPTELKITAFPASTETIATLIEVQPVGQRETIRLVVDYRLTDNKIFLRN